MSFDPFLHWFHGGSDASLEKEAIEDVFGENFRTDAGGQASLHYSDGSECDLHFSESEAAPGQVSALTVSRPCDEDAFWLQILRLLKNDRCVLFWPGGPLIFRSETTLGNIPDDMLGAFDRRVRVDTPEEVRKILESP